MAVAPITGRASRYSASCSSRSSSRRIRAGLAAQRPQGRQAPSAGPRRRPATNAVCARLNTSRSSTLSIRPAMSRRSPSAPGLFHPGKLLPYPCQAVNSPRRSYPRIALTILSKIRRPAAWSSSPPMRRRRPRPSPAAPCADHRPPVARRRRGPSRCSTSAPSATVTGAHRAPTPPGRRGPARRGPRRWRNSRPAPAPRPSAPRKTPARPPPP